MIAYKIRNQTEEIRLVGQLDEKLTDFCRDPRVKVSAARAFYVDDDEISFHGYDTKSFVWEQEDVCSWSSGRNSLWMSMMIDLRRFLIFNYFVEGAAKKFSYKTVVNGR